MDNRNSFTQIWVALRVGPLNALAVLEEPLTLMGCHETWKRENLVLQ